MRKKSMLALCAAVGVTASLMVGCSQEKKPVETGAPAVEQAVEDPVAAIDNTNTDIEVATEAVVEMPESVADATEDAEIDMEPAIVEDSHVNSGLKAPIENPDGSVTLYAKIIEDLGDNVLLVETLNGPFEITISSTTLVAGDGKLEAGEFIEFISDGVATMSLPGQMPNIFSILEITEEMAMANPVVTDTVSANLPAVERNEAGDAAKYYAQIKSLVGTDQMLVVTNEGEKIITLSEALINGNEYSTGDFIVFYSDGIETRSIPAQITSVNMIEFMDQELAKQTQAAIDRATPVDDSDINVVPTEETVELELDVEETEPGETEEFTGSESGGDSTETETEVDTDATGA